MFPLPWMIYVKIGICAVLLCGAGYLGYSFEHSRFLAYKAEQIAQTQKIEKERQTAADQIRKEKDAQIAAINNNLADALIKLRERPSRADSGSSGQGRTGLSLSAEDAAFLDREAARADILRAALDACYKQYDSLK
jgi:hypothetical protein